MFISLTVFSAALLGSLTLAHANEHCPKVGVWQPAINTSMVYLSSDQDCLVQQGTDVKGASSRIRSGEIDIGVDLNFLIDTAWRAQDLGASGNGDVGMIAVTSYSDYVLICRTPVGEPAGLDFLVGKRIGVPRNTCEGDVTDGCSVVTDTPSIPDRYLMSKLGTAIADGVLPAGTRIIGAEEGTESDIVLVGRGYVKNRYQEYRSGRLDCFVGKTNQVYQLQHESEIREDGYTDSVILSFDDLIEGALVVNTKRLAEDDDYRRSVCAVRERALARILEVKSEDGQEQLTVELEELALEYPDSPLGKLLIRNPDGTDAPKAAKEAFSAAAKTAAGLWVADGVPTSQELDLFSDIIGFDTKRRELLYTDACGQ